MGLYKATKQRVRIPAEILTWPVGYTSRKVYIALLVFQLRAQRHGSQRILKTYEEIAQLAGISNVKTVAACVQELADAGYIKVKAQMYWSEDGKKLYRGTNEYMIIPMAAMGNSYIWFPVKLLAARISPAAFSVLLFLLRKQGPNTRSWPSLRRGFQSICQKSGKPMPRKTICDALQQLRRCMMLIILPCIKCNTALSMNSYMLTVFGDWSAQTANNETTLAGNACAEGGYFFGGLPVRIKITKERSIGKEKRCFYLVQFAEKMKKLAMCLKSVFFACPRNTDIG